MQLEFKTPNPVHETMISLKLFPFQFQLSIYFMQINNVYTYTCLS